MAKDSLLQVEDALPNKCSALLRVALRDLKAVEELPDIEVAMSKWWALTPESVCRVCLAGSVMTQSFGINTRKVRDLGLASLGPSLFPKPVQFKFYALNALRTGFISIAYGYLTKVTGEIRNLPPGVPSVVDIAHYDVNKEKFYSDLEQLADQLEAAGD